MRFEGRDLEGYLVVARVAVLTILTALCLLTSAPILASDDLYVDAAFGSNSNDGLTWLTAKQTIQAGLDAAPCGGTVHFFMPLLGHPETIVCDTDKTPIRRQHKYASERPSNYRYEHSKR